MDTFIRYLVFPGVGILPSDFDLRVILSGVSCTLRSSRSTNETSCPIRTSALPFWSAHSQPLIDWQTVSSIRRFIFVPMMFGQLQYHRLLSWNNDIAGSVDYDFFGTGDVVTGPHHELLSSTHTWYLVGITGTFDVLYTLSEICLPCRGIHY